MVEVKRRIRITDKKPLKKHHPNPLGRPEVYQEKLAAYICQEIMKGRTLTNIGKDSKMPSLPTIYTWLNPHHPNHKPEFLKSYVMAREVQAEVMADELKDIADEVKGKDDNIKINRAKLRSDNRKWLAAHLLPTKFSDKMQLTGAGGKDLIPTIPTNVTFNFIDNKQEKE